jgi:mono/diheme cytochrome c family protein
MGLPSHGLFRRNVVAAVTSAAMAVALSMAFVPARAETAGPAAQTDAGQASAPVPAEVRYSRDVRPILSENCFACHGFDGAQRKADLRLDTKDGLFAKVDDTAAVVPGDPGKSAILNRIVHADPDEVMPPPKTGKKLTPRQVEIVRKWIEQGAKWEGHWAFIPPVRPAVPQAKQGDWARGAVDAFILARLEAEGLKPSPEADKATLIRRVTLDLTGLPPTPAEVDAFLADGSPDAYEKVVDRLLASPKYGERMALDWLDAARYADTHGYHIDSGRDMWKWREWVIDAYNANVPFDRFTVEQLAGDMLPNATLQQKIASGFNRNHMVNYEGGAIPEEYHAAYIMDRVSTTSTVWLGMTVACAQCHDHKYDPVTQKEFYQLYAFFNNVPENGLDGKKGNAVPFLKVPTPEQQSALDVLAQNIQTVEQKLAGAMPEVDAAQAEWEKTAGASTETEWVVLDPTELRSSGGATLTKRDDKSILASGTNPEKDTYSVVARPGVKGITSVRVEALPDDSLVAKGPGRSENGNAVLTGVRLVAAPAANPAAAQPAKFKAASADFSQPNFPPSKAIDEDPQTGWAIFPEVGKPHAAVFELAEPIDAAGAALTVTLDFQSIFGRHQFGRFRVSVSTAAKPHFSGKLPERIATILSAGADKRTDMEKSELRAYYRSNVSPEGKKLGEELAKLIKARAEMDGRVTTTMVMEEMSKPRDTHLLMRGAYDQKGEKVSAGVPAFLPPLPKDAPSNRLGLAKWLVDPSHPLTARVTVNRLWQTFFGTGIVKTVDDFGLQGEIPSHADLLDWLAVEFRETGWDVKKFCRTLVTSAAYRQSSVVSAELVAHDPENLLLARGPRHRLTAEFVRDQALALGGLLDPRMGGPSVYPYQPPGLWEELMSRSDGDNFTAQKYVQSHGADLYRRSMYTFWKRTSPPPSMSAFDAPDRETCTVRRARTNTPLQALVLLNDPTYVEASRKLAERMMNEPGAAASAEDRIAFAFRLATARKPTAEESAVLKKVYDQQLAVYRSNAEAATKLLAVGESPRDEKLDPADLAAWTTVASTILNLDETVTKG